MVKRRASRLFKTKEERVAACRAYCEHLEEGLSKNSFDLCDYRSIESHIERYPSDFPIDVIERAERAGQRKWERYGMRGMLGQVRSFNAMTWIFNMKNRYGWRDKIEHFGEGVAAPVRIEIIKPTHDLLEQLMAQQAQVLGRPKTNGTGEHPNPQPTNGTNGNGSHTPP